MIFSATPLQINISLLLYLFIMGKSSDAYGAELFIMLVESLHSRFLVIQANNLNKDIVES